MNRLKSFLSDTVVVWVYIGFVAFFFGWLTWRKLGSEAAWTGAFFAEALATLFVFGIALVVFCRLRHWLAWMVVLIVLAVLGTGIDLPYRFVFYPGRYSIVGALLTLAAVSTFWILERLERIYTGVDPHVLGRSDTEGEEKMITLDLDRDHRD